MKFCSIWLAQQLKHTSSICLCMPIAFAVASQAQTTLPAPPTTVVTVSGSPMPLATESASVTVISHEAIEASGAANAATLLEQSPYLNVEQQGGDMAFTTVTVRGGKPNLLLVMIDGVPVNDLSDALGGSFDFSSLARVEIVRGPLSSVYGSEAVSGVVNFITRKSANPAEWKLDDSFGSFGASQVSLSGAGELGRAGYSLGASTFTIGNQTGNDSAALYTGNADMNLPLDDRRAVTLVSRYDVRHANEYPTGSGGPEYALDRSAETDRSGDLVGGGSWQHQYNQLWLYRLEADLFRRTAYNNTPPILDAIPPGPNAQPSTEGHTRFSRLQLRDSDTLTFGPHWIVRASADWRHESGVETNLIESVLPDLFQLVRNTAETAAELSFTRERFSATVGNGTSSTPGYGTVASPRAGASLRVAPKTRLKGSYGQAFSLPSFYAYADPLIGNPNLRPEHLKAWDIGIEQSLSSHFALNGTWFQDQYNGLIDFSSAVFRLVNLDAAKTSGVEIGSQFNIKSIEIRAGASYMNWQLSGTTEPFRNQPHGKGNVSIDWRPNRRLMLGGDVVVMGSTYDYELPVPQLDRTGAYSTTSLRAQWQLTRNFEGHLRIDNAFNQRYQQFVGFPDPGIRARAGIAWTFPNSRGRS